MLQSKRFLSCIRLCILHIGSLRQLFYPDEVAKREPDANNNAIWSCVLHIDMPEVGCIC